MGHTEFNHVIMEAYLKQTMKCRKKCEQLVFSARNIQTATAYIHSLHTLIHNQNKIIPNPIRSEKNNSIQKQQQ